MLKEDACQPPIKQCREKTAPQHNSNWYWYWQNMHRKHPRKFCLKSLFHGLQIPAELGSLFQTDESHFTPPPRKCPPLTVPTNLSPPIGAHHAFCLNLVRASDGGKDASASPTDCVVKVGREHHPLNSAALTDARCPVVDVQMNSFLRPEQPILAPPPKLACGPGKAIFAGANFLLSGIPTKRRIQRMKVFVKVFQTRPEKCPAYAV